jgi:hypothetical protein
MPHSVLLNVQGQVRITARVNLRQGAPDRKAPVLRKINPGAQIPVRGLVVGEAVEGNAHWYRTSEESFVWSGACGPFAATSASPPSAAPSPSPADAGIDPSLKGFGLDPRFAQKLTTLLQACRERGHDFRISQGLRTPKTQARYYCQWEQRSPQAIDQQIEKLTASGAHWTASILQEYRNITRTPKWLTNALPGAGWHQWGEAADCYCFRGGKLIGNGSDPSYAVYADLAEEIGLTAGLRFSKPDAGHVQLRSQGGATYVYTWSHIDEVMKSRFSDKPGLDA